LLADLRLERRRFVKKKANAKGCQTTVLTLERLYFRQMPLTGWMNEEIALGSGEQLPDQVFRLQEISAGGSSIPYPALVTPPS